MASQNITYICEHCGVVFYGSKKPNGRKHCSFSCRSKHCAEKAIDRFWSKVNKTDTCWLWTGRVAHPFGYGDFKMTGKNYSSHRFAYQITYGEIPKGMYVCHKCDVPSCVNPSHLFLGNHDDNMDDMLQKKRNPVVKLNREQAEEIRAKIAQGKSYSQIAPEYGISISLVGFIKQNKVWK